MHQSRLLLLRLVASQCAQRSLAPSRERRARRMPRSRFQETILTMEAKLELSTEQTINRKMETQREYQSYSRQPMKTQSRCDVYSLGIACHLRGIQWRDICRRRPKQKN